MPRLSLAKLERHLYSAADRLRQEGLDAATYKDYIFGMLFLKRCSDVYDAEREKLVAGKVEQGMELKQAEKAYGENPDYYDGFFVPERARWLYLIERLNDATVSYGNVLDTALGALSEANESLEHVLDHISFLKTQGTKRLVSDDCCKDLVRHFSRHRLRNEDFQFSDLLGAAYEFLINMFAESAGKKGGDFYTPRDVIRLMVRVLKPAPGMSVYDPTCGSGGMSEVNFKKSPYGAIPDTWDFLALGSLLELVMDFRGRTPTKIGMEWGGGEIPALSAKNVGMGRIDFSRETNVGSEGLYSRWMTSGDPTKGDVVMTLEAPLGNVAWIPDSRKYILSQRVVLLRPTASQIDKCYLGFQLMAEHIQRTLVRYSSGTTATGIQRAKLQTIPILFPKSLDEQERIARILVTVDKAIAKTEAVIAKLRQVRAGLLHDLLTRGLDPHGQLRDPIAHPERFQDSPLGRIPKEWAVAPLRHFLDSVEYGISTSLSSEGSLPVLRMNNLAGGEASLDDVKFATREVPKTLLLRDGDVLFNRTNSCEHVGRTGIWRGQLPVATFASYLVRLNPAPARLTSQFLNLVLNMPESQQRMRRYATPAVQQVNINPTQL